MTTDTGHTTPNLVVHGSRVSPETLAAVVIALSSGQPSGVPQPTVRAWQLAALHEARLNQRIFRPQQLLIRGSQPGLTRLPVTAWRTATSQSPPHGG